MCQPCKNNDALETSLACVHWDALLVLTSLVVCHMSVAERQTSMRSGVAEDGMDQAKWAIPRSRHGAISHDIAKHEKPRLKLQCVWVHSIALHFFLIDPRVHADSSMVTECGARAIEHMQQKCQQMGRTPPTQLAVIATWLCKRRSRLQI